MASELRDRLTDLADHTRAGSPPADLWRRGVRRRRLAHAGSAAVVAALVFLLGAGGLTWHSERRIEPAAPHGGVRFPDRFYDPSPWLETLDGPPGRLVAVGLAERKSLLHTREAVYGVRATDGRYGFLDLPDLALPSGGGAESVALSPEGNRLAYWLTGSVPGTGLAVPPITGVGVVDLTSGDTRTWRVPSERGLAASVLTWSDDDTLVVGFGRWLADSDGTGGTSNDYVSYVWAWGRRSPERLADPRFDLAQSPISGAFGRVVATASHGTGYWLVDPGDPSAARRIRGMGDGYQTVVSPDGRSAARLTTTGRTPSDLSLFGISPHGTDVDATPRGPIGLGRSVYAVVSWADDRTVVVQGRMPGATFRASLESVDVRSGSSRVLAAPYQDQTLAIGLLASPRDHASPPPEPWDLRWLVGGIAFGSLVVGFFWWGMRRGRRP